MQLSLACDGLNENNYVKKIKISEFNMNVLAFGLRPFSSLNHPHPFDEDTLVIWVAQDIASEPDISESLILSYLLVHGLTWAMYSPIWSQSNVEIQYNTEGLVCLQKSLFIHI